MGLQVTGQAPAALFQAASSSTTTNEFGFAPDHMSQLRPADWEDPRLNAGSNFKKAWVKNVEAPTSIAGKFWDWVWGIKPEDYSTIPITIQKSDFVQNRFFKRDRYKQEKRNLPASSTTVPTAVAMEPPEEPVSQNEGMNGTTRLALAIITGVGSSFVVAGVTVHIMKRKQVEAETRDGFEDRYHRVEHV